MGIQVCEVCWVRFSNDRQYWDHMTGHTKCTQQGCNRYFTTKVQMFEHCFEDHIDPDVYKCDTCDKIMSLEESEDHIRFEKTKILMEHDTRSIQSMSLVNDYTF